MPFTIFLRKEGTSVHRLAFEREKTGLLTIKNNNVNAFHGNKNICHTKPIQLVVEVRRKTCSRCYFGAIKWSKSHPFSAHTGSQRIAQHDIFTFRSLSSQLEFVYPRYLGEPKRKCSSGFSSSSTPGRSSPQVEVNHRTNLKYSQLPVLNLVRPLTVLQKIKLGIRTKTKSQEKRGRIKEKKKIHFQGTNPVPLRQKHGQTHHECFYTSNHRQKHFLKPLFDFLGRGHNFNRTKIVGFLCKFTDLPTDGLTHNGMI